MITAEEAEVQHMITDTDRQSSKLKVEKSQTNERNHNDVITVHRFIY